jgi:hypothetical protein
MGDALASGQITKLERRSFIKRGTLHGRTLAETYELLQEVHGDSKLDHNTISNWSQRFCQGQGKAAQGFQAENFYRQHRQRTHSCISTVTMVTQTHHNVMTYIYCLPC